jgi:hypothetical protein
LCVKAHSCHTDIIDLIKIFLYLFNTNGL